MVEILNILIEEKTMKPFLKVFIVLMLKEIYRSLICFFIVELIKIALLAYTLQTITISETTIVSFINSAKYEFIIVIVIYYIFEHGGGFYMVLFLLLILSGGMISLNIVTVPLLIYTEYKISEKAINRKYAKRKEKSFSGEGTKFYCYMAIYILLTEKLNNMKYVIFLLALYQLKEGYTTYLFEIYQKKNEEINKRLNELNIKLESTKNKSEELEKEIEIYKEREDKGEQEEKEKLEKRAFEGKETLEKLKEEQEKIVKEIEENEKIIKQIKKIRSINMDTVILDIGDKVTSFFKMLKSVTRQYFKK